MVNRHSRWQAAADRTLAWGRLVSITGAAQIAVQSLGFLSGILVIRLLPTEEYALYTLANTMLGTLTLLADAGVKTSVMAEGGKTWQDRSKLGSIIVTGFRLRRRFAAVSLLLGVPPLVLLLNHHGASPLATALLVCSLVPAFLASLSGTLLEVAPKLAQDVAALQRVLLAGNAGRLALTALALLLFPFAAAAIIASGLPQLVVNSRLRRLSRGYADLSQGEDAAVRKRVLAYVKRALPGAVYFCVSGQITLWLISLFGSTEAVAQVGALTRLAMITALVGAVFGTLVVPRFARLSGSPGLLVARYLQVHGLAVAFAAAVVAGVTYYPEQVLTILGPDFRGLTRELQLLAIGTMLAFVAGVGLELNAARARVVSPQISIPFNLAVLASAVFLIAPTDAAAVFTINIVVAVSQVALQNLFFWHWAIRRRGGPNRP